MWYYLTLHARALHIYTYTNVVESNSVVGSLDVKALYPNLELDLELDFAIDIVCKEFYKSGITIRGIGHQELGLNLS